MSQPNRLYNMHSESLSSSVGQFTGAVGAVEAELRSLRSGAAK